MNHISNKYIYLRSNVWFDKYDSYKLGKIHNITKLNFTYLSSEIKDGWFECVYEILQNIHTESLFCKII
jgi:hypothetical protein